VDIRGTGIPACAGTSFGDCPRTKFKKQNWCGICAHSELEKLWRKSEAIQRENVPDTFNSPYANRKPLPTGHPCRKDM